MGAFAAALSFIALVDPRLRSLILAGAGLALVSLNRSRERVYLPALALSLAVPCAVGFSVGADSLNYFAYTSSILADRDLDLSNQWEALGFEATSRTATGLVPNPMAVGPGLIWLPAAAVAHLWLNLTAGPSDPLLLAGPYYAAAAGTTIAILLGGALLLTRTLSGRFGSTESGAAVAAVILASPMLYYAAVQPLMSHGLTFAFSAGLLALVLRAEQTRTPRAWALAGAAFGLAMLCRAQAAPLSLVLAAGLWRVRAGGRDVVAAATAAFLAFGAQLVAWRVLYGAFVTIPQGDGFIDWTGRRALDVLFSADRGLFNWHPVLLPGLIGLVCCTRGFGAYGAAGVMVFAFSVFLNGSVLDWNASAAFGARRFDIVLPLLALGLAGLLARLRQVLVKRPLFLPAFGIAAAVVWNLSLIDILQGKPASAMPLDDLAARQVQQLRRAADGTVGRLGVGARDVVYRAFVGLATYHNYRPGGDFDLATLEPRFLRGGWSEVTAWDDGSLFRYLLHPQACIVIPLDDPFDLRGFVLARSPARIRDQHVTLVLNGRVLTEGSLPSAWTEIPFHAPRAFWVAGENEFCVRARHKRPGDEGDDLAYAAAVIKVQLP